MVLKRSGCDIYLAVQCLQVRPITYTDREGNNSWTDWIVGDELSVGSIDEPVAIRMVMKLAPEVVAVNSMILEEVEANQRVRDCISGAKWPSVC